MGYCPCFVAIEVMQEMDDRSEMRGALLSSTTTVFLLYMTAGLSAVSILGWDILPSTADMMVYNRWGVAVNGTLFFVCFLDYMIAAITVNKWLQEKFAPSFRESDWSLNGIGKWFLLTLPSSFFAFLVCLAVPRIEGLTGLLTSVAVPVAQVVCPAWLVLKADRSVDLAAKPLHRWERWLLVMAIVYGCLLIVAGSAATVYWFIARKGTHMGPGTGYFCNVIG